MIRSCLPYRVLLSALVLPCAAWAAPELVAPEAPAQAVAGEAFVLEYAVTWPGEPEAWRIGPPEAAAVEGVRVTPVGAQAYVEDGRAVVVQQVEFVAEEAGELTLPDVSIPYRAADDPAGEDAGVAAATVLPAPAVSLMVTAPVVRPAWFAPALVGAVLAAGVLTAWALRRRQGRAAAAAPAGPDPLRAQLHAAQGYRLDGDHYGFYQALASALGQAEQDEAVRALRRKLEERARAVGFQGLRPPDDEMTGDYREVERAVARPKEDGS